MDKGTAGEEDAGYDWEKFDRELLFEGLDPGVPGMGNSSFRAILTRLLVPKGCLALDIGAGGFLGNTTTRHLVEVLDADVDAVEIDADLAHKLDEKFAGRIKVHNLAIQDFPRAGRRYDVIVSDLPMVPWQINTFAPDWLENLKPGGYYIFCTVYDLAGMFDGKEPLMDRSVRPDFEKFLLERFGTIKIDPRTAQKSFIGSSLTVRAIVDKWCLKSPRRGFGFIVLQKDGTALSSRPVPYEPPAPGQATADASAAPPLSPVQRAVAAVRRLLRG